MLDGWEYVIVLSKVLFGDGRGVTGDDRPGRFQGRWWEQCLGN